MLAQWACSSTSWGLLCMCMCVCLYMCASVCVYICTWVHICVWCMYLVTQMCLGVYSICECMCRAQGTSQEIFLQVTEQSVYWASISFLPPSQMPYAWLCFLHEIWGWNSCPCSCKKRNLLTEPSPQSGYQFEM